MSTIGTLLVNSNNSRKLLQIIPKIFPGNCRSSSNNFGRKMPKKSSGVANKEQNINSKTAVPIKEQGPVKLTKEGHFAISIQVKPGAKINAITDVSEDAVSVQISAPPVDGEANTAIVKYFAELLNLKKSDVSLKGGKSRQKTVTVEMSSGLTIEGIVQTLKKEQES